MGKRLVIIGADFSENGMRGESVIATPVITASGNTITITATEGSVYYTTDGSEPTINSTLYEGPFTITGVSSATIKAIAAVGGETSNIATYNWVDVVTPPTITVSGDTVTITAPAGTIYYTIDGSTPSPASTQYSAPFSMGATIVATIKAIAEVGGVASSEVTSYTYINVPSGYGQTIIDGTETWNFNNNLEPNNYGIYNCYSFDATQKFSNVKTRKGTGSLSNVDMFYDAVCIIANYESADYFDHLSYIRREDATEPGFNWFGNDPSLFFQFDNTITTSAEGFKTWLQSHPVTIIYRQN